MEVRNETIVKLLETLGGIIENRHTGIFTMQKKDERSKSARACIYKWKRRFCCNFSKRYMTKRCKIKDSR